MKQYLRSFTKLAFAFALVGLGTAVATLVIAGVYQAFGGDTLATFESATRVSRLHYSDVGPESIATIERIVDDLAREGSVAYNADARTAVLDLRGYSKARLAQRMNAEGFRFRGSPYLRRDFTGWIQHADLFLLLVLGQMTTMAIVGWWFGCETDPLAPVVSVARGATWGAAVGLVTFSASWVLQVLSSSLDLPVKEQAWVVELIGAGGIGLMVALLTTVLLAPVAEEIFFRGFVFRYLGFRHSWAFAYVVSTALFAVVHGNPTGFAIYFLIGWLLARSFRKTNRLITPIAAHALHNLLSCVLILLSMGD